MDFKKKPIDTDSRRSKCLQAMLIGESRWTRLERYSRWKSGRFVLTCLPLDVVDTIASFLDYTSHCALLSALTEGTPDLDSKHDVGSIPETLRPRWILRTAEERLEWRLREFVTKYIYVMRHVDGCVVLIDWSQFSAKIPIPVFRFAWGESNGCYGNRYEILEVIRRCATRHCPCVRATLHTYLHWSNRTVINPLPMASCGVPVLPWWILPEQNKEAPRTHRRVHFTKTHRRRSRARAR